MASFQEWSESVMVKTASRVVVIASIKTKEIGKPSREQARVTKFVWQIRYFNKGSKYVYT